MIAIIMKNIFIQHAYSSLDASKYLEVQMGQ